MNGLKNNKLRLTDEQWNTNYRVVCQTESVIGMGNDKCKFGSSQLAVWRNGGSNPAEKAVRN